MTNERILLVEPDTNIRDMLFTKITALGWQVEILDSKQRILPQLKHSHKQTTVFLSAALPDAPDQLKNIRLSAFRSTPVVITALHRTLDRDEKISFLELGADDLLSIEALSNLDDGIDRILNWEKYTPRYQAMMERRRQREAFETTLQNLIMSNRSWAYLDIRLQNFEVYSERYGWQVADMVVEGMLDMLTALSTQSTTQNQWYWAGRDNWVGIVLDRRPSMFIEALYNPVLAYLKPFYSSLDWARGGMVMPDSEEIIRLRPLMHLAIGMLTPRQNEYQSFTELIEAGEEKRRSEPILI
jgi:hypothetical protein